MMKTINPLDYQSHKNWEQIKAYCVAVVLGKEPEITPNSECLITVDGLVFNPNTYQVMGELMELLKIDIAWHRNKECAAFIKDHEPPSKLKYYSENKDPIQAVILCAMAIKGKVDMPEELLKANSK